MRVAALWLAMQSAEAFENFVISSSGSSRSDFARYRPPDAVAISAVQRSCMGAHIRMHNSACQQMIRVARKACCSHAFILRCRHWKAGPRSLAVACGHRSSMTHHVGIRQTFAALAHDPVRWSSY